MTKRIILAAVAALITTPALAADPYAECSGLFSILSDMEEDHATFDDYVHYEAAFKDLAYEFSGEARSDDSAIQADINAKRHAMKDELANGGTLDRYAEAAVACAEEGLKYGIIPPSAAAEDDGANEPMPVR